MSNVVWENKWTWTCHLPATQIMLACHHQSTSMSSYKVREDICQHARKTFYQSWAIMSLRKYLKVTSLFQYGELLINFNSIMEFIEVSIWKSSMSRLDLFRSTWELDILKCTIPLSM